MSELDKFQEGLRGISLNLDLRMLHDILYDVWQAARASRWRSMDSAPKDGSEIVTSSLSCDVSSARYWTGKGLWIAKSGFKPLAWHPLPCPPTPEELENLK